jgi:hypothetical protein
MEVETDIVMLNAGFDVHEDKANIIGKIEGAKFRG